MKKLIIIVVLFSINSTAANLKDIFDDGGYKASIATLVCALGTLPFLILSVKKGMETKRLFEYQHVSVNQDRTANRRSTTTRDQYFKAKQTWKKSKCYFRLGLLGACCTLALSGIATYQRCYS
jgi:hypothetical protein